MVHFYYQNKNLPVVDFTASRDIGLIAKKENSFLHEHQEHFQIDKKGLIINKNLKKNESNHTSVDLCTIDNKQYVLKTCKKCENEYDYYNEYLVAKYGLNELQPCMENFVFIYDLEVFDGNLKIYEEFVSNQTFEDHLKYLLLLPDDNVMVEIVKSILQVLLSLEVAQNRYHFCHYDLHLKNIMMKSVSTKNLEYNLFHQNCRVNNVSFVCKIIDFGISSMKQKNVVFGTRDYKQFGVYPFLLPAIDLFRFLFSLYIVVVTSKSDYKNKKKLESFLLFIFKYFFKLNMDLASLKNIQNILQNFCNISFTQQVFLNPYDLLLFLKQNEKLCCSLLDITHFPWSWKDIPKNRVDTIEKEIHNFDDALKQNYNEMEKGLNNIILCDSVVVQEKFKIFSSKFEWYLHDYEVWYHHIFQNNMQNVLALSSFFWDKNGFQRMNSLYRKFWCMKLYFQDLKEDHYFHQQINFMYKANVLNFFQNKL